MAEKNGKIETTYEIPSKSIGFVAATSFAVFVMFVQPWKEENGYKEDKVEGSLFILFPVFFTNGKNNAHFVHKSPALKRNEDAFWGDI